MSDHVHAAGDRKGLAGDETRVVGCKERDDARIILWLAHALQGNAANHRVLPFDRLLAFAEHARHHRRVGRSWADDVEQHALRSKLARHRLGEADETALARRIAAFLAVADAPALGRDVEDPATR